MLIASSSLSTPKINPHCSKMAASGTDSESVKKKITELRVVDLKAELEKRGLEKSGIKAALVDRLQKALEEEGLDTSEIVIGPSPKKKTPAPNVNDDSVSSVNDKYLKDVAFDAQLSHAQLKKLYIELGIPAPDVENVERKAATLDFKLQAMEVLKCWRASQGENATKEALLEGLDECGWVEAKEILEKKWAIVCEGIHYHRNNQKNGICVFNNGDEPEVQEEKNIPKKPLDFIGNIPYNILKIKIGDELSNSELEKAKDALLADPSLKTGIDDDDIKMITATRELLKCLEKVYLFGPMNLLFLPLLFHVIGRQDLNKYIDAYVQKIRTFGVSPLRLCNLQLDAMGMFPVEVKIKGDIKHVYGYTVEKFLEVFARKLHIKPHNVRCVTTVNGCFIIVLLLPNAVKELLQSAAINKDPWLVANKVIGIHIKGEEFISLLDKEEGPVDGLD